MRVGALISGAEIVDLMGPDIDSDIAIAEWGGEKEKELARLSIDFMRRAEQKRAA
jgi:hypothetical protein